MFCFFSSTFVYFLLYKLKDWLKLIFIFTLKIILCKNSLNFSTYLTFLFNKKYYIMKILNKWMQQFVNLKIAIIILTLNKILNKN